MSKKSSRAASEVRITPTAQGEGRNPAALRRAAMQELLNQGAVGAKAQVRWCLSDDVETISTYTGPIHRVIKGSDGSQITAWHVQWGSDPDDLDVFPGEDARFILLGGNVVQDLIRTKAPRVAIVQHTAPIQEESRTVQRTTHAIQEPRPQSPAPLVGGQEIVEILKSVAGRLDGLERAHEAARLRAENQEVPGSGERTKRPREDEQDLFPGRSLAFLPGVMDPRLFQDLMTEQVEQTKLKVLAANLTVPQVIPETHRIFYPHIWIEMIFGSTGRDMTVLMFENTAANVVARMLPKPGIIAMAMIDSCVRNFILFLKALRQPPTTREEWALPFALLHLLLFQIKMVNNKWEEVSEMRRKIEAQGGNIDLAKAMIGMKGKK